MARTDMRGREGDLGAVAAEYGVLLGFVILVIIVGVGMYGTNLNAFIADLATQIAGLLGV